MIMSKRCYQFNFNESFSLVAHPLAHTLLIICGETLHMKSICLWLLFQLNYARSHSYSTHFYRFAFLCGHTSEYGVAKT